MKKMGWIEVRMRGSHFIFNHPDYTYPITVPMHKGDMAPGAYHAIKKLAGIK